MSAGRPVAATVVWSAVADVVLVLVFVLIGRGSHDEGLTLAGTASTAWPFIVGLAVGWVAMRAWRYPLCLRWTGVGIWVATVVVGMLLRALTGQGTAVSFVIVATIVLGVFLLGWRGIALLVRRRRRR
ncbi:DUF3054 domain-containing protein [Cryobacterium tepidiphilum]|uniref:DUF3054 domain-containing protein n=1 Tax=Cryobacterium tepidiphilum TaxID=2486026 RepID=A0A3M8LPL0_9MICO|nr:DUF3054 domain-containing protein [Cryobacterium tepidiphilum]RNE67413.1 DUF3054 domain-containing protein [Cryobacterium tepidiphilum]